MRIFTQNQEHGKAKKASENKTTESFFWELEVLLKAINEYNVHNAMENVDWELCQNKYFVM